MARARLIKPGFFMNDGLAEVALAGRLLFAGLWTISDREGRLEDRPKRIKAEVMPFDNVSIDRLLTDLAERGFIVRYESGGRRLIQIVNFLKHQTPHMREPASTIPAPDEPCASTVLEQVKHQPGPAVPIAVTVTVPIPADVDDVPLDVREIRDTVMSKLSSKHQRDPIRWDEALSFARDYPGKYTELSEAIDECRRANEIPFPWNLRKYMPTLEVTAKPSNGLPKPFELPEFVPFEPVVREAQG